MAVLKPYFHIPGIATKSFTLITVESRKYIVLEKRTFHFDKIMFYMHDVQCNLHLSLLYCFILQPFMREIEMNC